ncbi:methyl-accepting chemotaxis protein [Paenibacillus sp. y28]|uniref:methyl-accepting chemotaxis protein n=1 Tax=Paenibacillus sp. y28 TaxID=3129110 RepID=UPI0030172BE8
MKSIWKRISLRLKLYLGFGGLIFFFIAAGTYHWLQLKDIGAQNEQQLEKTDLKQAALELKLVVTDLNSISTGLMVMQTDDYINKYNEQRTRYYDLMNRIGDTASTPEQQKWRSQLISTGNEYIHAFDMAVDVIKNSQNGSLTEKDIQLNMKFLYSETQGMKDMLNALINNFNKVFEQEAGAAIAESKQSISLSQVLLLISSLVMVILAAATSIVIVQSLSGSIRRLQASVGHIAEGDLRHKINSDSKDELGMLSQHFDHMIERVTEVLANTKQVAGALSVQSRAFQQFAGGTVAANSDILKAMDEIAFGAEEQAAYSEQITLLIGELEEEIRDIAGYTQSMREMSRGAIKHTQHGAGAVTALEQAAEHSGSMMNQVVAAIDNLSASSSQIGKIAGTITQIASQTNVLALNATIEAARAGAQGKGFAVIADEVRQLSTKTGEASKLVSGMTHTLQEQMKEVQLQLGQARSSLQQQTAKVNETGQAFLQIEASMLGINGQIDAIFSKMQLANTKTTQVANQIQLVTAISQQTAAGVEEVNSTSITQDQAIRTLAGQADEALFLTMRLYGEIEKFKLEETENAEHPAYQADIQAASDIEDLKQFAAPSLPAETVEASTLSPETASPESSGTQPRPQAEKSAESASASASGSLAPAPLSQAGQETSEAAFIQDETRKPVDSVDTPEAAPAKTDKTEPEKQENAEKEQGKASEKENEKKIEKEKEKEKELQPV